MPYMGRSHFPSLLDLEQSCSSSALVRVVERGGIPLKS
jgi:hypothetical protein